MLCNLAAILANGGHMPALPTRCAAPASTYDGVHNNSVARRPPNLPGWSTAGRRRTGCRWRNVYSVGDVLLAVGAAS